MRKERKRILKEDTVQNAKGKETHTQGGYGTECEGKGNAYSMRIRYIMRRQKEWGATMSVRTTCSKL
jgi:hypothetical protein